MTILKQSRTQRKPATQRTTRDTRLVAALWNPDGNRKASSAARQRTRLVVVSQRGTPDSTISTGTQRIQYVSDESRQIVRVVEETLR
jgi:hypothetical protein